MESFYRSNKDYQRVLEKIEASKAISTNNKKLIRAFVARLNAEGISHGRIKKYLIILMKISLMIKADFHDYDREHLEKILAKINAMGFSVWTVNDYKTTIKRFFKFMKGDRYDPRKYRWIKISKKGPNKYPLTYSDLLTVEQVNALVMISRNPMYRCLISLAYETAARPSELLTLTVGSLTFAEGFTKISLRESKTFTRTVYAFDSDRHLKAWLSIHPMKHDGDAPLFPSSYLGYQRKEFLTPMTYNITLKRLAERARIQKRVWAYLLRHTRITHLLEAGWNEVMIKKLVGHSLDSSAFKVYEHLAEKQVEEYILKQHHREKSEQKALGLVNEKACTFCKTENAPDADFCVHCNRAISLKGVIDRDEKEKMVIQMLSPEMIDKLVEQKVSEILKARAVRGRA